MVADARIDAIGSHRREDTAGHPQGQRVVPGLVGKSDMRAVHEGEEEDSGSQEAQRQQDENHSAGGAAGRPEAQGDRHGRHGWSDQPKPSSRGAGDEVGGEIGNQQHRDEAEDWGVEGPDQARTMPECGSGEGHADDHDPQADGH